MTRKSFAFLISLLLLSLLGNYYAISLSFGIYFLLGSIAVFLTIYLYGPYWGILVGIISSLSTFWLWGQYYGILIHSLEAIFIAATWRRANNNLLLLLAFFWLLIASPLIWFAHTFLIQTDTKELFLLMLKMPFNSLMNGALTNLLLLYLPLVHWSKCQHSVQPLRLPFWQVLLSVIITFIMLPPLFQISVTGQWMYERTKAEMEAKLMGAANITRSELSQQQQQYHFALKQLAKISAEYGFNSTSLQQHSEVILKLFPALLEITLIDTQAQVVKRFQKPSALTIDTPFYKHEHVQTKGISSNVFLLLNKNKTLIPYLVHEVNIKNLQGERLGIIQGYLSLDELSYLLNTDITQQNIQFSLLNRSQQVLYSSRESLQLQQTYDRLPAEKFDNIIQPKFYVWTTAKKGQHFFSPWQQQDNYILLIYGGEEMPFWFAFELPLAAYATLLKNFYIQEYFFFAIITLMGLALAVFSSQKLVAPLHKLNQITRNVPVRLEQKQVLTWPRSPVHEIDLLTLHFQTMAEALKARFQDIQTTNVQLEAHVQQRTLELQHERSLLQNLINSTSDLIFYKDTHCRYLGCNRAFEAFVGMEEALLLGRNDDQLFTSKKALFLKHNDETVFLTGTAQTYTHWAEYPNQESVMLEVVKTPVQIEARQLRGVIGIARNTTDRYQAEEALRYSQTMLRLVMDNIPQAIFWQDQYGVFLGCNRNFLNFTNLTIADEIVGQVESQLRLSHPHLISFFDALNSCQLKSHENRNSLITAFQRPDEGNLCWLELSCVRLHDSEGLPLARLGCFEDITERRRAEERLRQISKVLENNTEAILITDAQTHILAINRAFTEITGYSEKEALQSTPRDLVFSGQHDDTFYRAMWKSINTLGHWEGEILNRRKNGEIYPEWLHISVIKDEHDREITHYLAIFSDITERKKAEARLDYLAHYDELTGLPNRLFFHELLSQALLKHRELNVALGVMLVDLDRFKDINDTWGHNTGDVLLQEMANRLRDCLGEGSLIARLGGDDFIICLEHISQPEAVAIQAQTVLDAMLPPFYLNGHEVFVTSSIGIALFPDDGKDADSLLKNADAAMYSAKATGKNTYAFFTQQMNVQAHRRVTLESQLRHALERDEFVLYFQPQMHLSSGIITGAEVLIRWQHPEQGLILPHMFIPLAEETGLISPIGEWVLYHACKQHQQWRNNGLPILRIAVNLSSRQFRDNDLSKRVLEIIEETEMDPTLLELELTESMLMEDPEQVNRLLQPLKENSIQIAIDDFGTGYSSLSYLKRFPINRLKIDQSFIREIPSNKDDMAITRAIVALAHSLHLKVTAEGVETRSQMAFLKTLRCEEIQGYLLGRPMPADQFIKLVS